MKDILEELNGKEYTAGIYEDYDIRMCREDEYEDLRIFLKEYWREEHIFVVSKEVFDFQHFNKDKGNYSTHIRNLQKAYEELLEVYETDLEMKENKELFAQIESAYLASQELNRETSAQPEE